MFDKLKNKAKELSEKVDLNKAKELANEKLSQGAKLVDDLKKESAELKDSINKSGKAAMDALNEQKDHLAKTIDEKLSKTDEE